MERIRTLLADDDAGRMALRAIGGLLLGVGMATVFLRRSGEVGGDPWSEGVLFLVLAAPCAFLYGVGLLARRTVEPQPWQSVFLIFGLLLLPLALAQLVDFIGGGDGAGNAENIAWIFALTATAGVVAAIAGRVRAGLFLAGLASIVAWLALWDVVLADPLGEDVGTLRGLLLAIAAILAIVAVVLPRMGRLDADGASELVTAAGIAAVFGTGLTAISNFFGGVIFGFEGETTVIWDVLLLSVSLLLLLYGSGMGVRGPQYAGAIGLGLLAFSVGFDLDDESPAGKVLGWPLVLLLTGAAAFAASFWRGLSLPARGRGGADAPTAPLPPPD